jgi:hypothetical protein
MSSISVSSIVPQPLSTAPTTSTNLKTDFWKQYISERRPEVQQLNDALKSGNLADAQKAYNSLVALGNTVLHKDNPFVRSDRASDFNAIGAALQNGDVAGAQQAFATLESTFTQPTPNLTTPTSPENLSNVDGAKASASGVNIIA